MCTHSTHYVVQGSFHNSTDCNPILNMPFLPHFRFQNYPNIYIYLPFVGFLHFRRFLFFLISALLLIKIEQTKLFPGSQKPRSTCLMSQEMVTSMQRYFQISEWFQSTSWLMLKLLVTRKKVVNALVINLFNFQEFAYVSNKLAAKV